MRYVRLTSIALFPALEHHTQMIPRLSFVAVMLLLAMCMQTKAVDTPTSSLPDGGLIDDSEDKQNQELKAAGDHLITAKDYDGLEKLAASDRAASSSLGSGMVPIGFFYEGVIGEPSRNVHHVSDERLAALKAWAEARPESVTAKIALGAC
jgi:hypothetical protein